MDWFGSRSACCTTRAAPLPPERPTNRAYAPVAPWFERGEDQEPGERQREAPPEGGEPAARGADPPHAPTPARLDRGSGDGKSADRPARTAHRERQDDRLPQHGPKVVDPELGEPERHERRDDRHRDREPEGRRGAGDRRGDRARFQAPSLLAPGSEREHDDGDRERTDRHLQHGSCLRRRTEGRCPGPVELRAANVTRTLASVSASPILNHDQARYQPLTA